jgi:hypothetical protein
MRVLFLTCWLMPAGCWAKNNDCDPDEAIAPRDPRVQRCPASDHGH